MKVTLEQLEMTLAQHDVDMPKRLAILNDLEKSIQEEKENKEPRKNKKATIVLVQPGADILYYPLKVKSDFDLAQLEQSLLNVRVAFNNTKKGQKDPARSHVETFELAKAKQYKEEGLQLLSKEPLVIVEMKDK